jgi:hypothetical protein
MTSFTPVAGSFADETGHYVVDGIVAGDYRVQVRANGFAAHEEDLTISGPGKRNFILDPSPLVTGVVITAAGAPAARVQVEAAVVRPGGKRRIWSPGRTDGEGRFRFNDLEDGDLRVTVRHRGEAGRFGPEPLAPGERKEITLRLAPGGRVSGTAFWEDGTPAAGVSVMMDEPFRLAAKTDAGGSFTVDGLPPGDTSLWASREPRSARRGEQTFTVKLEAGEHKTGVKLIVSPP